MFVVFVICHAKIPILIQKGATRNDIYSYFRDFSTCCRENIRTNMDFTIGGFEIMGYLCKRT